jgi:hypothetical protein
MGLGDRGAHHLGRLQDGQHVAVSVQHLEVDGLQNLIWSIQLQEQHDEDPGVRNLLESSGSHIMVDQENFSYNSKHFSQQINL